MDIAIPLFDGITALDAIGAGQLNRGFHEQGLST